MFYDPGCYGRVAVGQLEEGVAERLAALPGEWLEFDAPSGTIVVRHIQPSSAPCLPTIASELVRMLAEIPPPEQEAIPGGDLYVHPERGGQLVRLRVEAGGAVHIRWAHPDYERAQPRPYTGGRATAVEPRVQRLNGRVTFRAAQLARAAREIEMLADTFEGLYPEGDCVLGADEARGTVEMVLHDVNLDSALLVERLGQLAAPGSLEGSIEVSSFVAEAPEQDIRFLFRDGGTLVQRPVLWEEDATCSTTS